MKAVKGNKVYTIQENQEKHYREAGFDIYDDCGGLLAYGRGKTVSYEMYARVVRELEELKSRQGEAGPLPENAGTVARVPGKSRKKDS